MRFFGKKQDKPQTSASLDLARANTAATSSLPAHALFHLQRAAGNFAVQQMLPSRSEGSDVSLTTVPGTIQTKLTVNKPGDKYEQEADRIADQVTASPVHSKPESAPPHIQRFAGSSTVQPATTPASVDRALSSPGSPLEPSLRQDMEQRFGQDFSQVRVHTGEAAEESAQDVNANAYTVGHNIVFGAGQPAPGSRQGKKSLAHELTHVVQQRAGHAHGMQRDLKASESLPTRAKITGPMGRMQIDFDRPITKEQAAQRLFVDGKVPDTAKLEQGPGDNSWTLRTFDMDGHQATLRKLRARTETVSRGKPTEPPVPGQWNPPPPPEITWEWTDGPTKPSTKPKPDFRFTKNYKLDEGQRPWEQLGQWGHGYEVAFDKPMTKDEVMNKLFDKKKITQGEVILVPMSPEPTPLWKVEVLGVDALSAWKRSAMPDPLTPDELPTGTPAGLRAHLENKTVPKDAVKHPDDVYVWEQEGYMVYVKTNNKGKDGYYKPQFTKLPPDEEGKVWMRYYMKENGMPPRLAWQSFLNDTIEISAMKAGMVANIARLPRMPRMPPQLSRPAGKPTTPSAGSDPAATPAKPSTPKRAPQAPPRPEPDAAKGGPKVQRPAKKTSSAEKQESRAEPTSGKSQATPPSKSAATHKPATLPQPATDKPDTPPAAADEALSRDISRRTQRQQREAERQRPLDPRTQEQVNLRREADNIYENARLGEYRSTSEKTKLELLDRFERLMRSSGASKGEISSRKGRLNELLRTPTRAQQAGQAQPEYLAGGPRLPDQGRKGTARPDFTDARQLPDGRIQRVHVNDKSDNIHQMNQSQAVQRARRYTDDAVVQSRGAQVGSAAPRKRLRQGPRVGPLPEGEPIVIRYMQSPNPSTQAAMVREHFRAGSPISEVHFGSTVFKRRSMNSSDFDRM